VIKISISTDTLKISSCYQSEYAKIDENGCAFLYKGKLDFIINLEKVDDKILIKEKHCDVILMVDDQVFFIELKNTENTIEKEEITEIMDNLSKKFQGTFHAFNSIKKLFKINFNKNIKINYIFYIHKNTFDKLKKIESLMAKLKNPKLLGIANKDLEVALIKMCGKDIYPSDYNTTITLINKK